MNLNTVRQLQSAINFLQNSDGDVATSSGCACDQPKGEAVTAFQQQKDQQMNNLQAALKDELNTVG